MQNLFTSRDVIALTGITARQLQWWDERRIVVPARQGHRRLYSMEDLAEVAVICEQRRRGISPAHGWPKPLFGNFGQTNSRHFEECQAAHVCHLPQRYRAASARGDSEFKERQRVHVNITS